MTPIDADLSSALRDAEGALRPSREAAQTVAQHLQGSGFAYTGTPPDGEDMEPPTEGAEDVRRRAQRTLHQGLRIGVIQATRSRLVLRARAADAALYKLATLHVINS